MNTLSIWRTLSTKPGGKWLFSRALCLKAPFFGTIRPLFAALRPEFCEVRFAKRRRVLNHLGTVHAIAMCNAAELAGGTMTDVTVPSSHRWIPKGMKVEYIKPAKSDLIAVATPEGPMPLDQAGPYVVNVVLTDRGAADVFKAQITMWVSPKRK